MIYTKDGKLFFRNDDELLVIEGWAENSLRIRSFVDQNFIDRENALTILPASGSAIVNVNSDEKFGEIINGKIRATIDHRNRITFFKDKQVILKEFIRLRAVEHDDNSEAVGNVKITRDFNSTLKLKPRTYEAKGSGADFNVKVRFEPKSDEKIYGMGQYQIDYLDLKNSMLELAQRNSQISVPFYISSYNYGFLWNNPGIGKVTFAKNLTEWEMSGSDYIDYWITAGDTPKEITVQYTDVTGRCTEFEESQLGLWQSKLRYKTSSELLSIVERYEQLGVKLSTIFIDYFHWKTQGAYKFDNDYWSNPRELARILKEKYGVQPIVSVWPTIQSDCENYNNFVENGYLIKVNKGVRTTMKIQGDTVFIDMTNDEAKKIVSSLIKKNYYEKGFTQFWLDVAEPGFAVYDFDNIRYKMGPTLKVGNLYPIEYIKMINMVKTHKENKHFTLIRGGWAGGQKYNALPWSGDIDSSFEAMKNQINSGLNIGIAGFPWWTTDIGGFHGGDSNNAEFIELMIRWFQYSTFSPVLRMHGDRLPHTIEEEGIMPSGEANEIWSFGEAFLNIAKTFIKIRELLKPYLISLSKEASNYGYPLMRALSYEFPNDSEAWKIEGQYAFGPDLIVAPISDYQENIKRVYLPDNYTWKNIFTGEEYKGGLYYDVEAPIEYIPVFVKSDAVNKFKNLVDYLVAKYEMGKN